MDELDKELLNEIQWTFPLVTRPFDAIAKKFNSTPEIVKDRLIKRSSYKRKCPLNFI
jgi:DNA-binding Lrp family transcriptional regulator